MKLAEQVSLPQGVDTSVSGLHGQIRATAFGPQGDFGWGLSYYTALWVAFTIAFLNLFVRPLLVLFTLPATILTLGLFLFVINAIVVMLASSLVTL